MEKIKKFLFNLFTVLWDSWGFVKGFIMLLFSSIKKPRIFFGYASFFFACKYADKRNRRWKRSWDQSYKQQGVIPYNDLSLIVCSPGELKYLKKRKQIRININERKLIKKAYYKTAI